MNQAVGLEIDRGRRSPRASPWAGMNQAVGLNEGNERLLFMRIFNASALPSRQVGLDIGGPAWLSLGRQPIMHTYLYAQYDEVMDFLGKDLISLVDRPKE